MSAGPPSALDHVWTRNLIFRSGAHPICHVFLSPEMRDLEGRRLVVLRLGQWPPAEVGLLIPLIPLIFQVPLCDFFTAIFTLFELVVQEERTQVKSGQRVWCRKCVNYFIFDLVVCVLTRRISLILYCRLLVLLWCWTVRALASPT